MLCNIVYYIILRNKLYKYIGESPRLPTPPNTDPLSYLSNYKRYQKIIYTRTVSNLMIHMNKYFVLTNI